MNLEHWNWNTRGSTFLQYDRMQWFVLLLQLQKSSNGPCPCAGSNVCTTSLNGLFRPFRGLLDHGSLELDQLPSPKRPSTQGPTGRRRRSLKHNRAAPAAGLSSLLRIPVCARPAKQGPRSKRSCPTNQFTFLNVDRLAPMTKGGRGD